MDSYVEKINPVLNDILAARKEATNLLTSFEERFQRLSLKFYPIKEKDSSVIQSKKKLKGASNDTVQVSDTSTSTLPPRSRPESIVVQSSVEEVTDADVTYQRPVRTAKAKAGSLKEPALNTKMRRDAAAGAIKTERISESEEVASPANATTAPNMSSANTTTILPAPTIGSSSGNQVTSSSSAVASATAAIAATVASSDSGVPMPMPVVRVKLEKLSILPDSSSTSAGRSSVDMAAKTQGSSNKRAPSDNEDEEFTAASKKGNDSIEIMPTEENLLEISDDETEGAQASMPPPSTIPTQPINKKDVNRSTTSKKTDASRPVRSTRSKQTTHTNAVKVKQEPVESNEIDQPSNSRSSSQSASSAKSTASTKSIANQKQKQKMNPKVSRAISAESVYEDALTELNKASGSQPNKEPILAHLPTSIGVLQLDATFVTTTTENGPELLEPRPTYVINKDTEKPGDTTFDVQQPKQTKASGNVRKASAASSIMTEDDSDPGSPVPQRPAGNFKQPLPVQLKNNKELFSPYQHKSTKQKIEMFEKLQSPVPQRQTRTKTRINKQNEENEQKSSKSTLSAEQSKPLRTNSATRYNTTAKSTISGHSMLIKSQSVDDIRKKNQAIANEKKKKRDDKLRQAQLQREAQEKEKMDKYKKTVQDKEQRLKEAQSKKQQEEHAKQLEQKRRDAERELFRKEQQAAAARKERENMKILAEQKLMQDKLRANQRSAAEKQRQYNANNGYNFDMLESGDSTDSEEKESRRRPPPPEWSLKENRMQIIEQESRIDAKIIDSFFSVEPRDVDLSEIFPNIDEKYLRRNSSFIWHTPPRYSMMPKY